MAARPSSSGLRARLQVLSQRVLSAEKYTDLIGFEDFFLLWADLVMELDEIWSILQYGEVDTQKRKTEPEQETETEWTDGRWGLSRLRGALERGASDREKWLERQVPETDDSREGEAG